jgi:hypothetical protein
MLIETLIDKYKHDEDDSYFRIFEIPINEMVFNEINELRAYLIDNNLGKMTISSEPEIDDFNLEGGFKKEYNNTSATVKIKKQSDTGKFFFTKKGIEKYLLSSDALINEQVIKIGFENFSEFTTLFTSFCKLNSSHSISKEDALKIETIKYVKPLTIEAQKRLPQNVLSWLVEERDIVKIPSTWKNAFLWRLLTSLSSEVYELGSSLELTFRGERRRKIIFDLTHQYSSDTLYQKLNNCCHWLYFQSKDIDSRHAIFNNQLSLLLNDDIVNGNAEQLIKIFEDSLENSKLAYRYYLQSSSKELAKNLTELNKTLFEYTSKIRQNTTDLINALWKDFTTTLGLLMLTFSQKKSDLPSYVFDFLGIALTIYLITSIALNSQLNFWFYKNIKSNLLSWQSKVYSYMSNSEFDDYALNPLKAANQKYRSTFYIILVFYAIMIISLLLLTFEINLLSFFKKPNQ